MKNVCNIGAKVLVMFGKVENFVKHTHCLARQVTNNPLHYNKLGISRLTDYLKKSSRIYPFSQGITAIDCGSVASALFIYLTETLPPDRKDRLRPGFMFSGYRDTPGGIYQKGREALIH